MFLLFACSEPRSTSKACRIQWTFLKKVLFKKFFICYFCLYHSLMLPRNNKNGSRERIVVTINKFLKSQYSINVFHIMAHNSDFLITSNSLNMNLLCDDNFDFIYTVCKLLAERTGMRCLDTSRREASSFTQKSQNFVFSFVSNLFASFISHLLQCVNYVQFCS